MAELVLFERAPEICVEVLSPSNSVAEINERRAKAISRQAGFCGNELGFKHRLCTYQKGHSP
jgi:hypothetical protein